MTPPLVTFTGVVHPWMCDVMGHLNVRYYAGMFDDASFQLLGHVAGLEAVDDASRGWADVRSETEYKHETKVGTLVTIRSHVTKVGRSSIALEQVLTGTLDGAIHAINRVTTVRFDLVARKSVELDAPVRGRAEGLVLPE